MLCRVNTRFTRTSRVCCGGHSPPYAGFGCEKSQSGYLDESLDESQTTPKLLRRVQYLSEEMSYLRVERYLEECKLKVSSSHLAELSESYEATQAGYRRHSVNLSGLSLQNPKVGKVS
jgi:hypothetical protein